MAWVRVPITNASGADHSLHASISLTYDFVKGGERGERHASADCTTQSAPYTVKSKSTEEYTFTVCSDSNLDSAGGFRDFQPSISQIDGFPTTDPRDILSKLRIQVATPNPPIVQRVIYSNESFLVCRIAITNTDSTSHMVEFSGEYSYAYTNFGDYLVSHADLRQDIDVLRKEIPAKATIYVTNPPYDSTIPSESFVVPIEASADKVKRASLKLSLSLLDEGDENSLVAPYAKLQIPTPCSYVSG